ncbi:MAG: mechanosensitive ion channel family protein [Chloroflexi bacterium]|nr:mechanosensitive ion channel family protein [Chloroflexota bacterium]MCL5076252.1 mechanosensitive ion channel family protein [Chloroflexota bacterium]
MAELWKANPQHWLTNWELTFETTIGPLILPLIQSIVVLSITWLLASWVRSVVRKSLGGTRADLNVVILISRIAYLTVILLGTVWVLGILGVSWTTLLTFLGVISLAISLAAQDILKNIFAGLYLLIERPFRIGEQITVRDFSGLVEDVRLRTTVLRTPDDQQVIIPNATIFMEVLVNKGTYSAQASKAGASGTAKGESRAIVDGREGNIV